MLVSLVGRVAPGIRICENLPVISDSKMLLRFRTAGLWQIRLKGGGDCSRGDARILVHGPLFE